MTVSEAATIETRFGICKVCWAGCPVEVTVEGGRATKVVGDRQSPIYGGYTCPKGRAMPEAHYSPTRVLHPRKRMPDGSYIEIPMEQALSEIAARIEAISAEHGAEAIAVYPGNGNLTNPINPVIGAMFIMAMGTYPDRFFSVQTIDQAGKVIAQALHGRWIAGPQPFSTAKTWIMVGTNPVISKQGVMVNPGQTVKQAVKNGMKLIVIDPRATESTAHAFLHIAPQPGQDASILAGILHVILNEGLYDADFVAANAIGIDVLKAATAPFTPEHVASTAGISAEDVVLAARTFAAAESGCVVTATGAHFPLHGTLCEYLALSLNTVCGRWVRAGEAHAQPHVLLPEVDIRAQPHAPYQPWDFSKTSRINALPQTVVGAPTGTLPDEILTPGPGQVRALICSGSNPAVSLPDQNRAGRALASLDLLVAIDVEMSNTARMAHYVIPDKMALETPACSQFSESMKYYGIWTGGYEQPYAQYAPAVVEPPAGSDTIESWEFFYELAKRLGKQITYFGNAAGTGQHWDKAPVAFPLPLERRPTTEEMFEAMCAGSRVPLAEVKQHRHGNVFGDLSLTVLPRADDCTAMLQLGDPTMMAELGVVFTNRGDTANPSDEFPLMLIPRRANEMMNSIGRTNPKLAARRTHNPAYLNPADIAHFGMASGDIISIRSRHGEIKGVVEAEPRLRAGTLSMSHCFGTNPDEVDDPLGQGGCTSRLMDANAAFDPIFGQPRMGAIPVAIEAVVPA
ncbi:molybdopterin-dependent oxidoreductase [Novosphingobium sp. CECT 9465]|uniref:molybdopterin-containing oxidoreductase family protein n=1 Tax=Novosphingobium sp. CECT 9465 TaxID=2829794 RepID=UPI001E3DE8C9|nr:molybdopterin-dependent oxidoreductase [Novosphingobium sp. CECT 9465]CAH0495415.1 Polysulfide reductase chain A [Novosphingobium sp. CECT 9465]